MRYAARQDLIDRLGEDVVDVLAERGGDAAAADAAVERALGDAADEIDAYLAAKYELPLATTPPLLVRLAADIAAYRMASEVDALTDERRRRYDDAVRLLGRIASGEVSLGLPDPPASARGAVTASAGPRRFGRRIGFGPRRFGRRIGLGRRGESGE